jgi:hypothetical protein
MTLQQMRNLRRCSTCRRGSAAIPPWFRALGAILGEAFIEDLYQSWLANGAAAIEAVLKTKPDAYLKVIASLLPKDIKLNVRPLDELSDEQLLDRLRSLTKRAAPLLAKLDDDGDDELKPRGLRH